jgi:hypothetical protein
MDWVGVEPTTSAAAFSGTYFYIQMGSYAKKEKNFTAQIPSCPLFFFCILPSPVLSSEVLES